jgi:hypothetical protein
MDISIDFSITAPIALTGREVDFTFESCMVVINWLSV